MIQAAKNAFQKKHKKGHTRLPQPSAGTCIPNSVAGVACDSTYSISRKWFSNSKHVRRPRLSYCELQNPITSFCFSELVVLQVGSFLAKKSSCTLFQKIQRNKSQMVKRGSCMLMQIHCSAQSRSFLLYRTSDMVATTNLLLWIVTL